MYSLTLPSASKQNRQLGAGLSAVLDFALSTDEVFEIYNNAPCGYHSLDRDGVFLRINNTELKWLGTTRDELIGRRRFPEFLTRDSQTLYDSCLGILSMTGDVPDTEFTLVCNDGTQLEILINFTAIRGESGELVGIRSSVSDITARKRSEKSQLERKQFVDRIISVTADFVYVYDVSLRQNVFANRETASLLGYTPDQMGAFGDTLFEHLIHNDDLPKFAAHLARILSAPDDMVVETQYRMRIADGTYRLFLCRDTVFARDSETGEVTQYIGVAQEITEDSPEKIGEGKPASLLKELALQVARKLA